MERGAKTWVTMGQEFEVEIVRTYEHHVQGLDESEGVGNVKMPDV